MVLLSFFLFFSWALFIFLFPLLLLIFVCFTEGDLVVVSIVLAEGSVSCGRGDALLCLTLSLMLFSFSLAVLGLCLDCVKFVSSGSSLSANLLCVAFFIFSASFPSTFFWSAISSLASRVPPLVSSRGLIPATSLLSSSSISCLTVCISSLLLSFSAKVSPLVLSSIPPSCVTDSPAGQNRANRTALIFAVLFL